MGKYEEALAARGYIALICVGFGSRPDGAYSVKIAAHPVLRQFKPETWVVVRKTIIGALDKLIAEPLDDLEWE